MEKTQNLKEIEEIEEALGVHVEEEEDGAEAIIRQVEVVVEGVVHTIKRMGVVPHPVIKTKVVCSATTVKNLVTMLLNVRIQDVREIK